MKIVVLGLRGFPHVQGGVEAHCENLYPRLAKLNCQITCFTRTPYVDPDIKEFKGVTFIPLDCPKKKSLEAIHHSFKAVLLAKRFKPDIVHIHAIGPSLVVPLARLLGLKVVITHHGRDYDRKKWGMFAQGVLRLGEALGCLFANEVICITRVIAEDIYRKFKRRTNVIPNGVVMPCVPASLEYLNRLGLAGQKYILAVGRFVPEKGFHDLIEAFTRSHIPGWKLVIAGDADHEDRYSLSLKEKAGQDKNIVLTGFITGTALEELYSQAAFFVLPSYHEGLPITLLEAMSYGLLCLVSDIPANRCVSLPDENCFTAGDVPRLSKKLEKFSKKDFHEAQKKAQVAMIREKYGWQEIAQETLGVYEKVVVSKRGRSSKT